MFDFSDKTPPVLDARCFWGGPDTTETTGDKIGGRGSSFLDLRSQKHLWFSCALRVTSEVVTAIWPKRVVKKEVSTLHSAFGLSLLADVGVKVKNRGNGVF